MPNAPKQYRPPGWKSPAERERSSPSRTHPGRKLYASQRWKDLRAVQLAQHPLCAECERQGRVTPATVCDHIEPHKWDLYKFWAGPFQSLCTSCHSAKTAKEPGAFGQ